MTTMMDAYEVLFRERERLIAVRGNLHAYYLMSQAVEALGSRVSTLTNGVEREGDCPS